jgi:hypothetical protein
VHVGACGYVLSYLALNGATSRGPGSGDAYPVLETLRRGYRGLGCVPSRVMGRSYSGLAGGEIILARGHQDGRKDQYGLNSGLVLFRLMVTPFQSKMVGLYLVWVHDSLAIYCWRNTTPRFIISN